MKKESFVRKSVAMLLSCVFALSVMMPVALADRPNPAYNATLLTPIYHDGLAYLPTDVMEMLLKEQGYDVQHMVQKPIKNVMVTIRQKDAIDNTERRRIWINWSDGIEEPVKSSNVLTPEHPYGRIEQYRYDSATQQIIDNDFSRNNFLNHQLLNTDGDGKVYVAVDDLNWAMQLLLGDPSYTIPTNETN